MLRAIGVDKLSPLTQGRGSKLGTIHPVDEVEASPLTQGRGSKHRRGPLLFYRHRVAPHTGARIETLTFGMPTRRHSGRPSHRGADRNSLNLVYRPPIAESPLTQGRGSKRGCGLQNLRPRASPLTQGRGSKRGLEGADLPECVVAPHTGARIETLPSCASSSRASRPSHRGADRNTVPFVATYRDSKVAPHTGARIETSPLAAWEYAAPGRPSHRGADRNSIASVREIAALVAPHTGARIETPRDTSQPDAALSRPSHRGADRNSAGLCRPRLDVGRPSHRGADRNTAINRNGYISAGRPSHRGADRNCLSLAASPPLAGRPSHRGADRNGAAYFRRVRLVRSPLTQGRGSKHDVVARRCGIVIGARVPRARLRLPRRRTCRRSSR